MRQFLKKIPARDQHNNPVEIHLYGNDMGNGAVMKSVQLVDGEPLRWVSKGRYTLTDGSGLFVTDDPDAM